MSERFLLLYIDPGTGSMLFTILLGIVSSLLFLWKKWVLRLKFLVQGGSARSGEEERVPYVIFSDSKRYWNLFQPICDEFERRNLPLEYLTASPDDPALEKVYRNVRCRFIGEGNRAYAKLNLLSADILLSTTPGLDVYQWKRSKNVRCYVHIFHAVDEALGYRMFGMDFYDAILLTGAFQGDNIRKLERLRNLPAKELRVVGSTYMDALREKKELAGGADHPSGPGTVLLAPSWGESSILNRFGEKLLAALRGTEYEIIVRPHPQTCLVEKDLLARLQERFPESDRFHWNFDNDNFEALRRADVLITDFSGIIFDYALVFGGPILYADTSFDKAPYDAAWVDEPLWRFEVLRDLGEPLREEDFPRIGELLEHLRESRRFSEGRERVTAQAWEYIGESAVRTVDYLVEKHGESA